MNLCDRATTLNDLQAQQTQEPSVTVTVPGTGAVTTVSNAGSVCDNVSSIIKVSHKQRVTASLALKDINGSPLPVHKGTRLTFIVKERLETTQVIWQGLTREAADNELLQLDIPSSAFPRPGVFYAQLQLHHTSTASTISAAKNGIDVYKDKDVHGNRVVTFSSEFVTQPVVVCNLHGTSGNLQHEGNIVVRDVTPRGFTYTILDPGGFVAEDTWAIQWIAAGDVIPGGAMANAQPVAVARSGVDSYLVADKDVDGNKYVSFPITFTEPPVVVGTVFGDDAAVVNAGAVVIRGVTEDGFTYNMIDAGGVVLEEDTWKLQWIASGTTIPLGDTGTPTGGVVIYKDLLAVTDYTLYVAPTLSSLCVSNSGMITPMDVRMALMDVCAENNLLTGELDFTDEDIIYAMRRAVGKFNETNVPITNFTVAAFPYRSSLVEGVCGYVLRSKAVIMERNNLKYSAGGVTVADKDKMNPYMTIASGYIQSWLDFTVKTKIRMNINGGYGYVASPYNGV